MAPRGELEQLALRPLDTISEVGDFTHAATPTPNFKADVDLCSIAALRFSD
jgi:hypothetical protein